MKFVVLAVVLALLGVMGWQHQRYLAARRGPIQDRQDLLYAGSTFHVIHFLRAEAGADVIEVLRKLRNDLEGSGHAKMVYAGRAAGVGVGSAQLGEPNWDAVVLVQYPSREAYDAQAASVAYTGALERFSATYSHGFERPAWLNLGLPLALLAVRAYEVVTRVPSHYPLVPAEFDPSDSTIVPPQERVARLDALREFSEDAVVVVNLIKTGTAEQRTSDRGYGLKMAGLFAEGAHGPMHMGRAVTLEGDAKFDAVAFVYYPGVDYMQRMLRSKFFTGIVGGKQPGDTLAVITVPVLSRL